MDGDKDGALGLDPKKEAVLQAGLVGHDGGVQAYIKYWSIHAHLAMLADKLTLKSCCVSSSQKE